MGQKDIVILGASGFAREVLWLIEENNKVSDQWNILGFIDQSYPSCPAPIHGYNIIGNDEWLKNYQGIMHAVCAVGNSVLRKRIIDNFASRENIIFPNIISHRAILSDSVQLGKGCIICANSILTVDIRVGNFVIVNLDCTVGHDAKLKDFVTLYPSINVSGNVIIEDATEIGTGAQIIQGLHIGKRAIVGAGSVVIKDIPNNCTAVGVPAKVIKQGKSEM